VAVLLNFLETFFLTNSSIVELDPNIFMAVVDAATAPKPKAEILINFLLEVVISMIIYF
jgi:hypothetical protein